MSKVSQSNGHKTCAISSHPSIAPQTTQPVRCHISEEHVPPLRFNCIKSATRSACDTSAIMLMCTLALSGIVEFKKRFAANMSLLPGMMHIKTSSAHKSLSNIPARVSTDIFAFLLECQEVSNCHRLWCSNPLNLNACVAMWLACGCLSPALLQKEYQQKNLEAVCIPCLAHLLLM